MTASPTCTKAALNLLGFEVGGLRLPLVPATEDELAAVRAMLVRHGLLSQDGCAASVASDAALSARTTHT
jgi:dihydrodipicolinate synthase/N-acetylneuraminate lyase